MWQAGGESKRKPLTKGKHPTNQFPLTPIAQPEKGGGVSWQVKHQQNVSLAPKQDQILPSILGGWHMCEEEPGGGILVHFVEQDGSWGGREPDWKQK